MRTLIVSDLHLGTRRGTDLLRWPQVRERLTRALRGADQLVLLGDVLELRDSPVGAVLERAQPALSAIGQSAGEARVVLVPGNHDHQLTGVGLSRRLAGGSDPGLRLERAHVASPGTLAAEVGRRLGCAVTVAYPGLWLRPDVYATHGHYLDCHNTAPRPEVVAAAAISGLLDAMPEGPLSPEAYERVLAPIYAINYGRAQVRRFGLVASSGPESPREVDRTSLDSPSPGRQPRRSRHPVQTALAALGSERIGRFRLGLGSAEVSLAARMAMAEVVRRLRIEARYVIFGHTHEAGEFREEWRASGLAAGGALINAGSWVAGPGARTPRAENAQGWCVLVEGDRPPRVEVL